MFSHWIVVMVTRLYTFTKNNWTKKIQNKSNKMKFKSTTNRICSFLNWEQVFKLELWSWKTILIMAEPVYNAKRTIMQPFVPSETLVKTRHELNYGRGSGCLQCSTFQHGWWLSPEFPTPSFSSGWTCSLWLQSTLKMPHPCDYPHPRHYLLANPLLSFPLKIPHLLTSQRRQDILLYPRAAILSSQSALS